MEHNIDVITMSLVFSAIFFYNEMVVNWKMAPVKRKENDEA